MATVARNTPCYIRGNLVGDNCDEYNSDYNQHHRYCRKRLTMLKANAATAIKRVIGIGRRQRMAIPRGTDYARVIQVIETESLRGEGKEKDECRIVRQYWNFEGELLAENDPYKGN